MNKLWIVLHEHAAGDDLYLCISDHEPQEGDVCRRLGLTYQPLLGDVLEIKGPISTIVDLDGLGRRLQVGRPWQGLLR